jgi:hypothetical protein
MVIGVLILYKVKHINNEKQGLERILGEALSNELH